MQNAAYSADAEVEPCADKLNSPPDAEDGDSALDSESPTPSASGTSPSEVLLTKAAALGCDVTSVEFAQGMDAVDPLAKFRLKFSYPKMKELPCVQEELVDLDQDCVYMCGHSLGLKPKAADVHMKKSLDAWGKLGILSHVLGELPAAFCDLPGIKATARLVGAEPEEIAIMNSLTVNLHLLLVSFYRPKDSRHKILIEARAFPSDNYAVKSQIRFHGYDPATSLIELEPREGEHTLRHEDILRVIEEEGPNIAVILFSGVQYYTGQKFDMEAITEAGHKQNCIVGFDLAHAVGNVRVELHDWDVDFACWCSYKYLNSGAGGIAGAFIHSKHAYRDMPKLHGWWSNIAATRFQMKPEPDIDVGVAGLRISNPPPWLACINLASLEVFQETTTDRLLRKQFLLTGYLELLLQHHLSDKVTVITPKEPSERGCQLSLMFSVPLSRVHQELKRRGALCDIRLPYVMRAAPVPLYNSFQDVHRFVCIVKDALKEVASKADS